MENKLIIFPGAFNPPHNTHINMACTCLENISNVDKIIFVPVGDMYSKNYLEKSFHRYNMLNLICETNHKLEVSDLEIKSQRQLYTYETLDYFSSKYKEKDIYLLIGSDNLKEFDAWKMYEYIFKKYKLIVVNRYKDNAFQIMKSNENLNQFINSVIILDNIKSNLSSTKIRSSFKKVGGTTETELPSYIEKYIKENKLYM